jgi:mxaJ protein
MSSASRRLVVAGGLSAIGIVVVVSARGWIVPPVRHAVFLDASTDDAVAGPAVAADPHVLRICADPNNMPFSNSRGEGFENKIAAMTAETLGRPLIYRWRPQRRGFVRNTLKAGECDLIVGVPASYPLARTTRSYYRSSYVFVSRRAGDSPVRSFDDPRLKRLRIGIQITGDDYENPPAAQALASRRIIQNVRGYTVYGDYSRPDPQRHIVDAVASGQVDVAIVWGPLAGYFARREPVRLAVLPVFPQQDGERLPFVFAISMAVQRGDDALADAVNGVIERRAADIHRILADFGVPLIDREGGG